MRENQNALSPVQNANPPTPMLCSQAGKLTKVYHADLITEWKRTLDRKFKAKRRKEKREADAQRSSGAEYGLAEKALRFYHQLEGPLGFP